MAEPSPAHLSSVDAAAWPGVATVPQPRGLAGGSLHVKRAEAGFARACAKAGLSLDGPERDLTVERSELFARIAASGWVGLAEGYMAREWETGSSQQLVDVLTALIRADYRPRAPRVVAQKRAEGGDLPPDLVALFSGDGMSAFQGHFATGVATTERLREKSHTPGAGKGGEPAHHFVDATSIGAPLASDRPDLGDAQRRSAEMLLAAVGVGPGAHVLEYPCQGGALAMQANAAGATVDAAVRDERSRRAVLERFVVGGVDASIRLDVAAGGAAEFARQRAGVYDAVVSMEVLEALPAAGQVRYLEAIDVLLAPAGRAGLQTVVRTGAFSATADRALDSLRAYVWPGLHYAAPEELARAVDRSTNLRIVERTSAPEHLGASLRLQRMVFDSHLREAAADGYDAVFRRLWTWQFALREALARLGMIDVSQMVLARRSRRGRR